MSGHATATLTQFMKLKTWKQKQLKAALEKNTSLEAFRDDYVKNHSKLGLNVDDLWACREMILAGGDAKVAAAVKWYNGLDKKLQAQAKAALKKLKTSDELEKRIFQMAGAVKGYGYALWIEKDSLLGNKKPASGGKLPDWFLEASDGEQEAIMEIFFDEIKDDINEAHKQITNGLYKEKEQTEALFAVRHLLKNHKIGAGRGGDDEKKEEDDIWGRLNKNKEFKKLKLLEFLKRPKEKDLFKTLLQHARKYALGGDENEKGKTGKGHGGCILVGPFARYKYTPVNEDSQFLPPSVMEKFNAMDTNKDGTVSKAEYAGAAKVPALITKHWDAESIKCRIQPGLDVTTSDGFEVWKKLVGIDGATIISPSGELLHFAAQLSPEKPSGKYPSVGGLRHTSARNMTVQYNGEKGLPAVYAIVISESSQGGCSVFFKGQRAKVDISKKDGTSKEKDSPPPAGGVVNNITTNTVTATGGEYNDLRVTGGSFAPQTSNTVTFN